jgi:hypothetical protein
MFFVSVTAASYFKCLTVLIKINKARAIVPRDLAQALSILYHFLEQSANFACIDVNIDPAIGRI